MVAFVGSAFVPGGAIDGATSRILAEDTEIVREPADSGALDYAAWAAGQTVLPRERDGHFYADASVDGSPVHFLVDTGASAIALTGADAQALGLYWSDADIRQVAQGASGPVYGVRTTLGHVALGGHEARQVEAVIIPEGLGISLLGQSFLSTIEPVRIEGDRMVLGE